MNLPHANLETAKQHLLIVEDEMEIGSWLQQKVNYMGKQYSMTWATSIDQAKSALAEKIPTLIILDLRLPDGNGVEILKYVKSKKWPIKVIVFSINTGMRGTCLRQGADAFFDKISQSEELIDYLYHHAMNGHHKTNGSS